MATRSSRPTWMTVCAIVCALAVLVNVARDVFFAPTRDVEVWLGLEVHGWLALATAPVHWGIFGLGAWAFWTGRAWAAPAAAAYLFYAGLSHLVWSEASVHGRGWQVGVLQAVAMSAVALSLLRLERVRRSEAER